MVKCVGLWRWKIVVPCRGCEPGLAGTRATDRAPRARARKHAFLNPCGAAEKDTRLQCRTTANRAREKKRGGGATQFKGKQRGSESERKAMNDLGRKKLRTWLQKSLADHPENDNGLVAYVEAIVGDAEGEVRCFRFRCGCRAWPPSAH